MYGTRVGVSTGCGGCGCLGFLLGAVAVISLAAGAVSLVLLPWYWPLFLLGATHAGWLAELAWLAAVFCLFAFGLGGHRARKAARTAQRGAQSRARASGPRDWNPDDTLEM
jgi:hypothetical protein